MRKILLLAAAAIMAVGALQAKDADELRFYLNPGHGSFGPNDRPLNTINHQHTSTLSDGDTLGFYEGRGTLPRAFAIGQMLKEMGVKGENIVYSRLANGPFPYNDEDPDSIKFKYNRNLTEICYEVEQGNFDMFISSHSNANKDGDLVNYVLSLYRGTDSEDYAPGSKAMAQATWPTHWMDGIEVYSNTNTFNKTKPNIRGDISFYGSSSTRHDTISGQDYTGYLGVLKHGVPGYLLEGFFHTYQPARHRALNFDYDRQEGRREARGLANYFTQLTPNGKGDIAGVAKDLHERMDTVFYSFAPNTHDMYVPLNGATVNLYQGDNIVRTYTTDGEWNGFFAFEDVEPGEYTLDVVQTGYKQLGVTIEDETSTYTRTPITVPANDVAYAILQLEANDYVPTKIHWDNYPEPDQPEYLKIASEYVFGGENTATFEIVGEIKDVAQRGDSTVILTNDGLTPHLYLIDNPTQQLVKELSVEGIYSEESTGFYSPLNAITFTADNKLVGVSLTFNQYGAGYVDSGYTRGTTRVYIWDDNESAPRVWASTQNSGNYYRAVVGQTIAVNGQSDDASEILITAVNQGSTSHQMRLVHISMFEDSQVATFYDNLVNGGFNANDYAADQYGKGLQLAISPNDDTKAILSGAKGKVSEFTIPTGSAGSPSNVKQLADGLGINPTGLAFFKHAKHNLMVAPYAEDGAIKGFKLIDITGGVEKAKLIKTVNSDLTIEQSAPSLKAPAAAASAGFAAAFAKVNNDDIDAYLTTDNYFTRFTTQNVEQGSVKGIYAYNLNSVKNADGGYTFTFDANDNAEEAFITFRDSETGAQMGTVAVPNVVEGSNTITIAKADLPGNVGDKMNWEVTLKGKNITDFTLINNLNDFNYSYTFNILDKNPQSDYFGRIYVGHRPGTADANNGLWIYNPDYTRYNSSVIKTRSDGKGFRSNFRLGIDSEGKVYMSDWGDPTSGVFVFDPANENAPLKEFFANEDGTSLTRKTGTSDKNNGLLTNANGDEVAGSTPGLAIAGSGANTKLYVLNEDILINGDKNNLSVYSIGNPDGTIKKTYNQTPDATYYIGDIEQNGNCDVVPDEEHGGVWVSQYRGKGNNNGVASLIYVNAEGQVVYKSGVDAVWASEYMNGSNGAGFNLTPDGKQLVLNDGDTNICFYDIEWTNGVPALVFKYKFKPATGIARSGLIYQMNFDYAGNLVMSGAKVGIYAIPTENNQTTTPAKKALLVEKDADILSITLNHTSEENIVLKPGETLQLEVVAVEPAGADASVTWSSSDETIATVDENGLVTALESTPESIARRLLDNDATNANTKQVTITATSDVDPNVKAEITITVDSTPTGIEDISTANKTVKSVKYYNAAGMESTKPFDGVNIVVKTYTDGTKAAGKIIK